MNPRGSTLLRTIADSRIGMLMLVAIAAGCNLDSSIERSADASLMSLEPSSGSLTPPFEPDITDYRVHLGLGATAFSLAAEPSDVGATAVIDSPRALTLGENSFHVTVTAPDSSTMRTYTIVADRGSGILQQAFVKASNAQSADEFGGGGSNAAGLNGLALDGSVLAVGAPGEASMGGQSDNSAPGSGAVYVFARTGAEWHQEAYLKAPNAEANDHFGCSLALSGDSLVIGATGERSNATTVNGNQLDNSANGAGAAYVFVRGGSGWSLQAYLKPFNTNAGDRFGSTVDIDGNRIIVGADAEDSAATGVNGIESDNSAINSGAAYVFLRTGTTWTQEAYLKPSNTRAAAQFGASVAIEGDTVVVGSQGESSGMPTMPSDTSTPASGAAYVFTRDLSGWSETAYIKAASPNEGDFFGSAVAVSGDTVVVGANSDDGGAAGINGDESNNSLRAAGAVFVFVRSGTSWLQQAYVKPLIPGEEDLFGSQIVIDGDTLAVSARGEASASVGINGDATNDQAFGSGAAYLFTRVDGSWSQRAYIKASNTSPGDSFGRGLALSGTTVAVGAFREDSSGVGVDGNQDDDAATDSGAVYVFE